MDFLSLLVYRYTNHILKYFKSYDVFPKKKNRFNLPKDINLSKHFASNKR